MLRDVQYASLPRPTCGISHHYGPNVHLVSRPYPISLLARLCAAETHQPAVNALVNRLYDWLCAEVCDRFLEGAEAHVSTRMQPLHREGVYVGERLRPEQRAVVVDVARGGILPSLRLYDNLNHLLQPEQVRLDHVLASRTVDEHNTVNGVAIEGRKIGGDVQDATIFIPDPMAATGTSVAEVIQYYKDQVEGAPRAMVAVHLIVTPEYLKTMSQRHPDVHVVAVRLDRGLSPDDVLSTVPGTHWDRERGLNDNQYIVPGGGGLGEVMNNAWV